MKVADTNRLERLIRRASSGLWEELVPLHVVTERKMLAKLLSILDNPCYLLHSVLADQRSTVHGLVLHRRNILSLWPINSKIYGQKH